MFGLPLLAALEGALGGCATAQALPMDRDPTHTDGDKYHVLLENERVRVLRYHDEPGQKTQLHHHPDFIMYALAPFQRRLTAPDGTQRVRNFAAGDIAWMPAQSHIGENVGSSPTEVLLIEMKAK
jgi:quercetin dioxygenase-like cupin family protein